MPKIPDVSIGFYSGEDGDVEVMVKGKYVVCPQCEGTGKCLPDGLRGHAFTQEDFEQDPDLREQLASGFYEVTCGKCKGARVVVVPDEDKMDQAEKDLWAETLKDEAHMRQMERMETQHERLLDGSYW